MSTLNFLFDNFHYLSELVSCEPLAFVVDKTSYHRAHKEALCDQDSLSNHKCDASPDSSDVENTLKHKTVFNIILCIIDLSCNIDELSE